MEATIETPTDGYRHKTVFSPEESVTFPADAETLEISRSGYQVPRPSQTSDLIEWIAYRPTDQGLIHEADRWDTHNYSKCFLLKRK